MLTDSHCHLDRLDLAKYQGSLDNALAAAKAQGITQFLTACITLENFEEILTLTQKYENIYGSVGVHPSEQACEKPTIEKLVTLLKHPKIVGVGETGLDYSYAESDRVIQQDYFRMHIAAAQATQKPLIIHTRQANDDLIGILKEADPTKIRAVMHCFTESWALAKQALDWGFYISLSGIVTFKNALALREVAAAIPIDRLLIETDAPFIAPEPYRGKPNEPAYLAVTAEYLANLRKISYATLASKTTENFKRLFLNV